MSLVECRYNPNHRMKPSKREIHEQKCPDRFKCKIKYKHCPYDPLELIKEEDYEKHLLECKSKPKITVEEQKAIERAKQLNDIAKEKEQIRYAREQYIKRVEEPDIKLSPIIKKEEEQFKNDKDKKEQNNQNRPKFFYKYDPNDEDKDVGKFSANILMPSEIYHILH